MSCRMCSAIRRGFVWHKENSLGELRRRHRSRRVQLRRLSAHRRHCAVQPDHAGGAGLCRQGGPVLGICNGFQILCEAGLLPGALIRNRSLQFRCEHVFLKTATPTRPFTDKIPDGKLLRLPIAHGEGCYFADDATAGKARGQPSNPLAIRQRRPANRPTDPTPTAPCATSPASATRRATWPA